MDVVHGPSAWYLVGLGRMDCTIYPNRIHKLALKVTHAVGTPAREAERSPAMKTKA